MFILLLLLLAGLLSFAAAWLTLHYAWSFTVLVVLLLAIALWCDIQLISNALRHLRKVTALFDYTPIRRHYPTPQSQWFRRGYRQALLLTLLAGGFGTILGGVIGWFVEGIHLVAYLALLLGVAYTLPMLVALRHLAHAHAQTRRFIAERID